MDVLAVFCIRNQAVYMPYVLKYLSAQGVDIVILDHGSTDGLVEVCKRLSNDINIIDVITIPFTGKFPLKHLLELKTEVASRYTTDWIIHHDADEIFVSSRPNESLSELISRVDAEGYNALNFEEYVFLPESDDHDYSGTDFVKTMRYCYKFAPYEQRLVRAFHSSLLGMNITTGGHKLTDDAQVYPENHVLKHYMCLSLERLKVKHKNRRYAESDVNLGWHSNRIGINWDKVVLPKLSALSDIEKTNFAVIKKYDKHFWEWSNNPAPDE